MEQLTTYPSQRPQSLLSDLTTITTATTTIDATTHATTSVTPVANDSSSSSSSGGPYQPATASSTFPQTSPTAITASPHVTAANSPSSPVIVSYSSHSIAVSSSSYQSKSGASHYSSRRQNSSSTSDSHNNGNSPYYRIPTQSTHVVSTTHTFPASSGLLPSHPHVDPYRKSPSNCPSSYYRSHQSYSHRHSQPPQQQQQPPHAMVAPPQAHHLPYNDGPLPSAISRQSFSLASATQSSYSTLSSMTDGYKLGDIPLSIKPKRKRASSKQLEVLNHVFETTSFPSTEMRHKLARELGMTPRTVQIWFQNKRQAIRMQNSNAAAAAAAAAATITVATNSSLGHIDRPAAMTLTPQRVRVSSKGNNGEGATPSHAWHADQHPKASHQDPTITTTTTTSSQHQDSYSQHCPAPPVAASHNSHHYSPAALNSTTTKQQQPPTLGVLPSTRQATPAEGKITGIKHQSTTSLLHILDAPPNQRKLPPLPVVLDRPWQPATSLPNAS